MKFHSNIKQLGYMICIAAFVFTNFRSYSYSKDYSSDKQDTLSPQSTCKAMFATCKVICSGGIATSAKCDARDWFPSCDCTGIGVQENIEIIIDQNQNVSCLSEE